MESVWLLWMIIYGCDVKLTGVEQITYYAIFFFPLCQTDYGKTNCKRKIRMRTEICEILYRALNLTLVDCIKGIPDI